MHLARVLLHIKQTCKSFDIDFRLTDASHVIYEADVTQTPCAGFFTKDVLAVAINKPLEEWFPILLHESSHMDQYLDDCKEWTDTISEDGTDICDLFFEWLDGKELSIDYATELAKIVLAIELDCEKRTVEKIKTYQLESWLNTEEYIKKANSYVYFYLYALEKRSFYKPGFSPYTIEEVWNVAPNTFHGSYDTIPKELYEKFEKCLKLKA